MKLDEFLTNALIESLQNGLIAPELIIVYAGNYLTKSLITADDMAKVQNAVTAYQAEQANDSSSASEFAPASTSASESASASASVSDVASASASEATSAVANASASATVTASETAASNTNQPA